MSEGQPQPWLLNHELHAINALHAERAPCSVRPDDSAILDLQETFVELPCTRQTTLKPINLVTQYLDAHPYQDFHPLVHLTQSMQNCTSPDDAGGES